ncbi:DUF2934 domain-containing protein [Rhizobium sp. CECT 9324]|uniref:DUF2934 domain-containing protein n=1 Tax=Rhizobium sp. CECT 9324 TaxID=2845820 RepID=UPI001E58C7A6|nr:DUF2934 domain-containing protein [Rhizobium sp. CECT 9324]
MASDDTDAKSRQQRLQDRAYEFWRADGSPDGLHEEHWRRAELELGDNAPHLQQDGVRADDAGEASGLAPEAPQAGLVGAFIPPARSGRSSETGPLVEAADKTNPVHHLGTIPTPVTGQE